MARAEGAGAARGFLQDGLSASQDRRFLCHWEPGSSLCQGPVTHGGGKAILGNLGCLTQQQVLFSKG